MSGAPEEKVGEGASPRPRAYALIVALSVLLSSLVVGAAFFILRPAMNSSGPRIVTLDVVKLTNAERAAVTAMIGKSTESQAQSALSIMRIGRQILPTVKQVAGPGAVVLVRQAVVVGHFPDITDKVLKALGLPENAPTVDPANVLKNAPTDSAASIGAFLLHQQQQAKKKALREFKQNAKSQAAGALP